MASLKVLADLKKSAQQNSDAPTCQILKPLGDVPQPVAVHLPNIPSLKKTIQRHKAVGLPANPQNLDDLEDIPRQFSVTRGDEPFLLYDSLNDEEEELECGRVIIFASENHLKQLIRSRRWYCDGTFKVSPLIFYQLFTILCSITYSVAGRSTSVVLPMVYALLASKQETAYRKVFRVVRSAAATFEIPYEVPLYVMSDFEVAIINAIQGEIGDVIRACFFHLSQSVWRQIQAHGLARWYNDPQDRSIRDAAHQLCALAFVPLHDVESIFDNFKATAPVAFQPILDYFEVNDYTLFVQ